MKSGMKKKEIIEELKRAVQEKQKEKKTCILSFDLYPGVRKEEIMELANALQPDRIFDIEDCAKDEETLLREFNDYITDDRVFGIMCHKTIDTWFESEKLKTMKKTIETEYVSECVEEKRYKRWSDRDHWYSDRASDRGRCSCLL